MAKPKKATGAWKIRNWTPLNVVDLGEKSSCSLLQESATWFIGFSGCQPARIPPCLSSHRGEHCNYIWRFPKIWGYPQSSSILEDGIFHDINHHFRATPMTSWKPPRSFPGETFLRCLQQRRPSGILLGHTRKVAPGRGPVDRGHAALPKRDNWHNSCTTHRIFSGYMSSHWYPKQTILMEIWRYT